MRGALPAAAVVYAGLILGIAVPAFADDTESDASALVYWRITLGGSAAQPEPRHAFGLRLDGVRTATRGAEAVAPLDLSRAADLDLRFNASGFDRFDVRGLTFAGRDAHGGQLAAPLASPDPGLGGLSLQALPAVVVGGVIAGGLLSGKLPVDGSGCREAGPAGRHLCD